MDMSSCPVRKSDSMCCMALAEWLSPALLEQVRHGRLFLFQTFLLAQRRNASRLPQ